jgi:multidrug efflux pump subunit AcrA (membrane-fusion protein)
MINTTAMNNSKNEGAKNGRGEELALMSEEVKEILGATPRWIVQWGNVMLLLIVLMLIGLSGFIKYPEVVAGRVLLVPVFKTTDIRAPAGSVLRSLYVHDGDSVTIGQPLFNDLRSPAAGKVIFRHLLRIGNVLRDTPVVLQIVPWKRNYEATVRLASAGSGKIALGQRVVVSMDDFPSSEFGNLLGTVASLPEYSDNTVSLSVSLDQAAGTTYRKELPIYRPMEGTAEITTSEKRLSRQIFSFLR